MEKIRFTKDASLVDGFLKYLMKMAQIENHQDIGGFVICKKNY